MNAPAAPTGQARLTHSARLSRGLAALLTLVTALALGACGTSNGTADASPSSPAAEETKTSGDRLVARSDLPQDVTTERAEEPTPESSSSAQTPSQAPTTWSAPSVKFYNEDTSIWHQDDSAVNPGTVDDNHNIEGYRTNNGTCLGYVSREASQAIFSARGDDKMLSSVLIERSEQALSNYNATSDPVVVDLVRDDSGTLQGYERAFTANHNSSDGSVSNPVEGYRFARTVGDEGFRMAVLVLCDAGSNLSVDQWHTILGGLRLEGMDAGPM